MKRFFLGLLLITSSFTLVSAQEVVINVKFTSDSPAKLSVYDFDIIKGRQQLSKSNYDSMSKSYHLKLNINQPLFTFIDLGYRNQEIYIKPNALYELIINPKTDSVLFAGKDHIINNFLQQYTKKYRSFLYNNKPYNNWSVDEFIVAHSKLDSALTNFRENYFSENPIESSEKQMIVNLGKAEIISDKMDFLLSKKYNPYYAKSQPYPVELIDIEKKLPIDNRLLFAKNQTYQIALRMYYQLIALNEIRKTYKEDVYFDYMLDSSYHHLDSLILPPAIKEFILSNFLMFTLSKKIEDNFYIYYDSFKNEFPKSIYIKPIEGKINRLNNLSQKPDAIDFTGTDLKGNLINLSSFRGKIVYIDFWATWCGPCIKEMALFEKIQDSYKNNANIVFLFTSIDSDSLKWRSFLEKHSLIGYHVNIDENVLKEIKSFYLLDSVPRYLIIDKLGKVYNPNAPHLSSPSLKSLFESMTSNK